MFALVSCCSNNPCLNSRLSDSQKLWLKCDLALAIIATLGSLALCGLLLAGVGSISVLGPIAFPLLVLATLIVIADAIALMKCMVKRHNLQQAPDKAPRRSRNKRGNADLTNQIEQLNKETASLRQQITVLEGQVKNHRGANQGNPIEGEILQLKQACQQAELGLNQARARVLSLQQQVNNFPTQQVYQKKGELERAQSGLKDIQRQIGQVTRDLEILQSQNRQMQQQIIGQKQAIQQQLQHKPNEEEMRTKEREVSNLETQCSQIENLMAQQREFEQGNEQLTQDINKLTQEGQGRLQEDEKKLEQAQKTLNARGDQQSLAKASYSTLEATSQKEEGAHGQLKTKLEQAKEREKSAKEKYDASQKELNTLQQKQPNDLNRARVEVNPGQQNTVSTNRFNTAKPSVPMFVTQSPQYTNVPNSQPMFSMGGTAPTPTVPSNNPTVNSITPPLSQRSRNYTNGRVFSGGIITPGWTTPPSQGGNPPVQKNATTTTTQTTPIVITLPPNKPPSNSKNTQRTAQSSSMQKSGIGEHQATDQKDNLPDMYSALEANIKNRKTGQSQQDKGT